MRIGVDVGRVLHGHGGVTVYTRELVRAVASPGVSHEILCFDLDRQNSDRKRLEDKLGPLPDRVQMVRPSKKALSSLDLFHAPGFLMPRCHVEKCLFTLHDLTVLSLPNCHTLDNRIRTLESIADALCRGATMLAVSRATRDEAVRLLNVPGEQIEVLGPILDEAFSASSHVEKDLEIRRAYGVQDPYLLAVGSLEPRKNLGRLLAAWQSLSKPERRGCKLVILAIEGWRQAALRSQLESLSRQGAIVLLEDPLSSLDLAALYRGARALVFPSLAEGFGLPIAEAMACGTPVITSDRSSMPEVAGEAAILIDPEDEKAIASAMERILQDRELARISSTRGLERSRQFTRDSALPRLLEIYRNLAAD